MNPLFLPVRSFLLTPCHTLIFSLQCNRFARSDGISEDGRGKDYMRSRGFLLIHLSFLFFQILSRTASHGLPNFQRNRLPMARKHDGNQMNDLVELLFSVYKLRLWLLRENSRRPGDLEGTGCSKQRMYPMGSLPLFYSSLLE